MAVVSSVIYLQLIPVMREVLTMSKGERKEKESEEEGKLRNRPMLEIIMTISTGI